MRREIDVEKARRETPGCRHGTHLNAAGAALMPETVIEAQISHIRAEGMFGGYEAARRAQHAIDRLYTGGAALLGCHPDEIAFSSSGSRAWQALFYAVDLEPGDRILTTISEYAGNYLPMLHRSARTGCTVEIVPEDSFGCADVDALASMMNSRVKIIAITHVAAHNGGIQPIAAIGQVAARHDCIYLVDASQSIGQILLDVTEIGCDALTGAGRKFLRAPRGTALSFISRRLSKWIEPAAIDLRSAQWTAASAYSLRRDARRFESWEQSIAAQVGLAAALEYALNIGTAAIEHRVTELAAMLRTGLAQIDGVVILDSGRRKSGIVTFTLEGWSGSGICNALATRGLFIWQVGAAVGRLSLEARGLDDVARAAVHYYNTEREIDLTCEAIRGLAFGRPE